MHLFVGMNEVGLHSFLGKCALDVLASVFLPLEKQFISYEEMKAVIDYEKPEEHEMVLTFWVKFLLELSKYEKGQHDI